MKRCGSGLVAVLIRSARLRLSQFEMADADDVFECITPAVARFMRWEPPRSLSEYRARRQAMLDREDQTDLSLVVRRDDSGECLGIAGLDGIDLRFPELGVWLKEPAQGHGYGGEAVRAVAKWASETLGKKGFIYPVAVQNLPSRRIAEGLGGEVVRSRTDPKYETVIYRIPAQGP